MVSSMPSLSPVSPPAAVQSSHSSPSSARGCVLNFRVVLSVVPGSLLTPHPFPEPRAPQAGGSLRPNSPLAPRRACLVTSLTSPLDPWIDRAQCPRAPLSSYPSFSQSFPPLQVAAPSVQLLRSETWRPSPLLPLSVPPPHPIPYQVQGLPLLSEA